jgi:hypothetical protein
MQIGVFKAGFKKISVKQSMAAGDSLVTSQRI